eukprot:11036348-Alexandrium_andersonii.AAC.1
MLRLSPPPPNLGTASSRPTTTRNGHDHLMPKAVAPGTSGRGPWLMTVRSEHLSLLAGTGRASLQQGPLGLRPQRSILLACLAQLPPGGGAGTSSRRASLLSTRASRDRLGRPRSRGHRPPK